MNNDAPDVQQLMKEIGDAARKIEERPISSGTGPRRPFARLPNNPRLDENWDSWELPRVTTHRGAIGLPVVWLKRFTLAVLRLHDRELLKKQRDYNREVKDELYKLRQAVADLSAEVAALKQSK